MGDHVIVEFRFRAPGASLWNIDHHYIVFGHSGMGGALMRLSWSKLPRSLVSAMLRVHSTLGVAAAGLLYLVCLTGSVAVFAEEISGFELRHFPKVEHVSGDVVQRAVMNVHARSGELKTLWVTMPTPARPHLIVSTRDENVNHWIIDSEGRIEGTASDSWGEFIIGLHADLHVPGIAGHVLVGLSGIALMALVISGLLAHPALVKDAFRLRLGRSHHRTNADIHNRAGVWSMPFLFLLGLSGALMGLSTPLIGSIAGVGLEGGPSAASAAVLGPRTLSGDSGAAPLPDLRQLIRQLDISQSGSELGGIVIFNPGTMAQTVRADLRLPDRLSYADRQFYDGNLQPLLKGGLLDTAAGIEVYSGLIGYHFGDYGGLLVKVIYAMLGLVACILIYTGMKLWFLRRRVNGHQPQGEWVWLGVIWGTPLALLVSYIVNGATSLPSGAAFYIVLAMSIFFFAIYGAKRHAA